MINSFYNSETISVVPVVPTQANDIYYSNRIKFMFEKIFDNGHPQLRSNALAIGGYVCMGLISESIAYDTMVYCIKNNKYLQKDLDGYLKTAEQSFNLGKKKPFKK
jgi:hypothetical protein